MAKETPAQFVVRRNGAPVSLEDIAEEIETNVQKSELLAKALEFLDAKYELEEALEDLGFEFG